MQRPNLASFPIHLLGGLALVAFLAPNLAAQEPATPSSPVGGTPVAAGTEISLEEFLDREATATASAVDIESTTFRIDGFELHFLTAGPQDGLPVLLLHGARYSAQDWRDLGTLDLLAQQGFRALAMDLPGYGKSPASEKDSRDLLTLLLPLVFERPPVIVSPSMSGHVSLPAVADRASWIGGFVPIAPGTINENLEKVRGSKVPTLIFWGKNDTIVPLKLGEKLAKAMPASRLVVLDDAGHACYLDKPFEFHRELLQFLKGL